MRTLLFLLLCWGLGLSRLAAQSRAAGPWRIVNGPMRVKNEDEQKSWGRDDTTTSVVVRKHVMKAAWNIHPDSIRLFLACENPLTAPPANAGIRFAATGATLRLDTQHHLLWLAPADSVVVLRAYRGQRLAFRHEFRAVAPPAPMVKCYAGGAYADDARPDEESFLRTVTLKVVPDRDFAAFMPEDARYRVARFLVTVVRPGNSEEPLVFNGPQGNLSKLKLENGDRLLIDVQLTQRQNFRMEVVEVPLKKHIELPGPWQRQ